MHNTLRIRHSFIPARDVQSPQRGHMRLSFLGGSSMLLLASGVRPSWEPLACEVIMLQSMGLLDPDSDSEPLQPTRKCIRR